MATVNPFDVLGDDDSEDPSQFIAAQLLKVEPKKPSAKPTAAQAKLPSKPLPPSQAVREARSEPARGGRSGGPRGGYGRGRGSGAASGGAYRDSTHRDNSFGSADVSPAQGNTAEETNGNRRTFERRSGYGGAHSGRGGGFNNGDAREGDFDRPRRTFDRRSGTGRGYEMKREGSGRGNWGTEGDEVAQNVEEVANEGEKPLNVEKISGEDATVAADKEGPKNEAEEKEPEVQQMTLEEYEKVLEEKRKALMALKTEQRKVDPNEFASMQPLANKKASDDVFIKLGSDKDKKKELAEKEEKAKKSMSINAFLKPVDGEKNYNRGRGRGGGGQGRGGSRGGEGYYNGNITAPAIEDPSQFPSLGGGGK